MIKKIAALVTVFTAAFATVASAASDTYTTMCVGWLHEPEMPAELKKEIK